MELTNLLDLPSAAIVIGGTLAATLLRCGWGATRDMLKVVVQLLGRPFDSDRVRAELAAQIQRIDIDGLLRAEPHRFDDGEFDDMADVLIARRSIQAVYDEHEKHRVRRLATTQSAADVLGHAAELAPVLGLAGTLLSLSGLATGGVANADYAQAIGFAIVTTLYGLLLANFLFNPLSAAVQRRAQAEEAERQRLLDWLAAHVARSASGKPGAPARARAAA